MACVSTAVVLDRSHNEKQICLENTSTPRQREQQLHLHTRYMDVSWAEFSFFHQQSAGPERVCVLTD